MSILNTLILTTAISIGTPSSASEKKAIEMTSKALYKYHKIDKQVSQFEKKHIPQWIKERPWIIYAIKVSTEKKISYQWSF